MDGPINFSLDIRKEVFTFFEGLLRNYQEPIYYEYIRGHVSKASLVVRKYVASKCKGEKLLEYFKLRKNYFIVDGTDVLLKKDPCLRRKRVQSECASEVTRGRKKGRINDKENTRSYSLCSAISDSTGASSSIFYNNTDKKKEHEDYVDRYFSDLLTRHDKVVPSSLDYDTLPKKVKRHLDLYYKKKVANYFANFPDKFSFDKEGNVSFKIRASCDSSIPLESSTVESKIFLNSAVDISLQNVNTTKKSAPPIDHEILTRDNGIEAMLFFTDVLVKKKTPLTVDQLGGYLSQAPKDLRTFLKFNFNMLKNFFEEYSIIFLVNSSGEVTLSKSARDSKLIIEKMKKVVSKALIGSIPVHTMKAKLDCIIHPVQLSMHDDNSSELAEMLPINEAKINIIEQQSNYIEVRNEIKVTEETAIVICQDRSKELAETTSKDSTGQTYVESNGLDYNGTISEDGFNSKSKIESNSSAKIYPNSSIISKINEISNNESVVLTDRAFLEFFLTFELFCLEMTEKDFEFTVSNELKAIQYFIEVLSEPPIKDWYISNLHGTIGKASAEVSSFLKKKYKGDKFASFFEHQTEFKVRGPFIKLSSSYQETFSKRITALSVSANRNSKWDLLKLYESNCYKEVSNEVGALFNDICSFLENKSKTKLSRLEGIVTRFPKCLEWIKALDGTTLAKKIGSFLGLFSIFEIFIEDYVYFSQKESLDTIKYFFKKAIQNEKIDFVSLIPVSITSLNSNTVKGKSDSNTFELCKDSCYFLKSEIKNKMPIRYCEVVKILPTPILLEVYNISIGTRIIIDTMLKSGEFFFRNGKIDLKPNLSVCSENGFCNFLISIDNEFQTQIKDLKKNENNILKVSTGSATTFQQTNEIHCNTCHNAFSSDELVLDDSYTPNEVSQSSISTKICSNSNNCNKNQLESSNVELAKCNSQTLDSKEVIEIESTDNDTQILSQKSNANETESIVPVKDCTKIFNLSLYSSELNDPVDVFENTDSPVPQNAIEYNSEDDFDSLVEDCASETNHCETHSISSLEDDFAYTSEENINISDAKGIFAEIKYLEDQCVSSQLLDSYEESILSKDVKLQGIILNTPTMDQYIDLLNEDDELTDNYDTNENISCINKTFLNHNHTKIDVPGKQNVSAMLNSDGNEICYLKVKETSSKIDGHESVSEIKHKAELLAKEVFQNSIHNIQQNKIFVACTTVIFLFKKNYLSKMYGPLKCNKKDISKNLSETVPVNNKACISSNDSNSLNNLKLTLNESLSHDSDITAEVTLQDIAYPKNNSCPLNMNLNNCEDTLVEYPLQQMFDSTSKIKETAKLSSINNNDAHVNYPFPEKVDSTNSCNSNVNLGSNDSKPDPINEYPLQPILAEVVLLTADSCIAVAEIESRKQNIYFLKCVFVCDHQFCCSDCFNDLKISDTVSCFVPPTEMSRKMWISVMVSKETTNRFEEIDSFSEVIRKQNEGGYMNRSMCINSKSVSIQTEHSYIEFGCQTESSSIEQACQTQLCGDVKLCAITENSMSQTNVPVQSAQFHVESQTNHSGEIIESPTCADVLCQTDLPGEVKLSLNVVNTECQTISTGQVMITKYYHL